MKTLKLSIIALMALTVSATATASTSGWDDDDDIYYNPATAPSQRTVQPQTPQQRPESNYIPNTVVNYPAADTFTPAGGGLNIDIDAYNRNGQFLVSDTTAVDSTATGNPDTFGYTRRIERFYNGDIVTASGDADLINYYYDTPSTSTINVYVVDTWPSLSWYASSWFWGYPYYGFYPYYGYYGYYNPWYSWVWNPYWSYSWNWGWGCYPYHHHHHHGWHYDDWHHGGGYYPGDPSHRGYANSAGSARRHAPSSGSDRITRPGAYSAGITSRPGNMGRGRGNTAASPANRPGTPNNYTPATTPGRNNGSGVTPGNGLNRGRNNGGGNRSGYTPSPSPSRNNNGGYHSGGGSRGGGGHNTGGGSRGGGGGGNRGRR